MKTTHSFIKSLVIGATVTIALAAVAMAQTATPNYSQTPTPTATPSPTVTPVISTPNCVYFMRNMGVGTALTTAEMNLLNNIFVSEGLSSVLGMTYNESYAANMVKIQAHYGIIQTGFFGPITRARVNAIYGCAGLSTMTISGGSTSPGGSGGSSGGGTATVVCPQGYTCTPVNPNPVTVTCPVGYTCVPMTVTTPTAPTIGTAPLPYSPTTYTTATDVNGTASILNTFTDHAGTWGQFYGGHGILNQGNADWNVQLTLAVTDNTSKTIRSIGLYHTGAGAPAAIEGWSTASSDDYGRSSFPLVVLDSSGQQLDGSYNQTIGTISGTARTLTLSGQVETQNWYGGKVIVDFTDGTQAVIPVGITPYSPTNGGGSGQMAITGTSGTPTPGSMLTISGSGFTTGTAIDFLSNGQIVVGVIANSITPNQITIGIPSIPAGLYMIQAVNGSQTSNTMQYQVVSSNQAQGTINSVSPNPASPGTLVTITGSNLNSVVTNMVSICSSVSCGNYNGSGSPDGKTVTFVVPSIPVGLYNLNVIDLLSNGGSTGVVSFTVGSGSTSQAPVVNGGTFPTSLNVGQTGTWTVNATDPNNNSLSYSVDWGDTSVCPTGYTCTSAAATAAQQSATFTHSYANAGTYTVRFTVRNSSGMSAQTSATVTINGPTATAPTATLLVNGQHSWTYNVGDVTSYRWSSTNADTFSSTYTANNPTQCGAGNWYANTSTGSIGSNVLSSYAGCVWTVIYTAKNSQTGQSASDSVTVTVNSQNVTAGNLQAWLVGTPAIARTNITPGGAATTTFLYTATFNIALAAVGGSVNVYMPISSTPAGAFYSDYQIMQNGVATNNVQANLVYSQPVNTTLSSDGSYFTLGQSQTATIPVTISFTLTNPGSNTYGVQLTGINWFNSQGKSQTNFSGSTSFVNAADPSSLSASIWQAVSDWYTAHPSSQ